MKTGFQTMAAAVLMIVLLTQFAFAESISFTGSVAAGDTHQVYAHIGGVVDDVAVEAGQSVKEGDVIASLKTTKVYATTDGIVTGVFAQVGDNAETIGERYGAVMYIEGRSDYTVAASTENAYNATETKFVHIGETVYLKCRSDGDHTGTGVITSIEGENYTVQVESGEFLIDESVDIYRSESYKAAVRVGRGTIERKNPIAVGGTGSIVSLAVANGDSVKRGELLFETLEGSFDGLYMSGSQILADASGLIASLNVKQGEAVQKDSVAAVIYPAKAMRIEAEISEVDLGIVHEGDPVEIELIWNQDDEISYDGVISMISGMATESAGGEDGESEVTYTVYVDFTPDENTRYGMSAVVSTLDADQEGEMDEEE